MKHISLIALAVALLPGLAMAASTDGTGHADAKIVTPVTVSEDAHLNFGTMLGQANTVTVSTGGVRSATTGSALVNDNNTPTAGTFTVTGPNSQPITVSLPANVQVTSGSDHMTISNLTNDAGSALDSSGQMTIKVGGSLAVSANQPEGDYTGTYTITVNY